METLEFSRYLRRRGMSPRTIALYARTLRAIDTRCRDLGTTPAAIDLPELDELLARGGRSRSSRVLTRSVLRHFWAFAGRADPPLDAIPIPPKPRYYCRALSEPAALALEQAARAAGDPAGLAVLLGLYAALRRSEIACLRWDEIGDDGWLTLTGKGDLRASIPLHPVLVDVLRGEASVEGGEFVFPGVRHQGHVSPATVWNWVGRVAALAGVAGVTPHVLRHTALATALDRNHDLRAVQSFARHARPETTALYTRTTVRRLRAAVEAIDYRAAAEEVAS